MLVVRDNKIKDSKKGQNEVCTARKGLVNIYSSKVVIYDK